MFPAVLCVSGSFKEYYMSFSGIFILKCTQMKILVIKNKKKWNQPFQMQSAVAI